LPALKNAKVMWELCEGVLAHLNPGQGQIFPAFMHKGAGQHAAKASLALLGIYNKVTLGGWNLCLSQGAGRNIITGSQ
jgi:hypothetical protein